MKNAEHPELRGGEVFLTNSTKENFRKIGWKSKRMGTDAYDIHGNPINPSNKLFPVFVERVELEGAMINW